MRQAILFSGLLHFILLILMLFGLPNPFPNRIVQSEMAVVIEFAPVSKETKAPILAPHDTAKNIDINKPLEENPLPEDKIEQAKPEETIEQKAAAEEKAEVVPPNPKLPETPPTPVEESKKPIEQLPPLPEPEKVAEKTDIDEDTFPLKNKKVDQKKELPKKEELKKEDKKTKEAKKETPPKDKKEKPLEPKPLDQPKKKDKEGEKKAVVSLDNKDKKNVDSKNKNPKKKQETLDDLLVTAKESKPKKQSVVGVNAQKTDVAFSTSEIAKLKAHISKCWHVHAGAKNAKEHIVDIDIHMNPDGFVEKAEIVDKSRMASDPFYKVAAETAQRSLLAPDCNPLPIPKSDYKNWADITFRFDPKEMF
jgi:hypothetical protein